MITTEMLKTLQNIQRQQEKNGAAIAPEINVYEQRTSCYSALKKLAALDTINIQEAPTTRQVKKTYTITEFGATLVEKAVKAEMID